uniref:Uncharacterized protein n=1 Tax=Sphaerodactylus townsendi TaxID=933632 RepID=A0ACB8FW37_9SAUR
MDSVAEQRLTTASLPAPHLEHYSVLHCTMTLDVQTVVRDWDPETPSILPVLPSCQFRAVILFDVLTLSWLGWRCRRVRCHLCSPAKGD